MFPILFRKSKDKVYTWSIDVIQDKDVYLVTKHGIQDGKIQEQKRKVVAKGKNTEWEQGIKQAKKKWEDRKSKDGYTETIKDRPFITPMLAQTLKISKNKPNMEFPFYVQPKLDGFRCMSRNNKEKVELISRTNIEYKGFATLKDELFINIFSRIPKKGFGSGNLYLDGELYIHSMPFEELSGKLKKAQNHEDVDVPDVQFRVFDCFDTDFLDIPFSERTEFLKKLLKNNNKITFVPTCLVQDIKEMKDFFSDYITEGYEGLIARSDSNYEINKRSSCLKKYKECKDEEFEIVNFKEAEGRDKGTVIWVCKTRDNIEFSVRPRGSIDLRKEYFKNGKNYIGKKLTVIYQELSENGVPRFPVGKDIRE